MGFDQICWHCWKRYICIITYVEMYWHAWFTLKYPLNSQNSNIRWIELNLVDSEYIIYIYWQKLKTLKYTETICICWDMLRYMIYIKLRYYYENTIFIVVEIGINIMRKKKRRDWVSAQPLPQQRRQSSGDRDVCFIGFRKSKDRLYFDGV